MDNYTFWSLTTSIIAAFILTGLTGHWIYTIYGYNIISNKATKNIENARDSSMRSETGNQNNKNDTLSSKITTTITISLVLFTLLAYIHVIIFGIHSMPKYETQIYRSRTLYILPLRIIPLTFMYIFFYQRLKGIFSGSVYSINKPIYKRFVIFSLVLYNILLILIEISIVLSIEFGDILHYGHSIMIILCIFATTIEAILSIFLVCVALKRLYSLIRATKTVSEGESDDPRPPTTSDTRQNTSCLLKKAAAKIFLCTIIAAFSTQISVLMWAIETRLYITQPPIIRVNIDIIINALCIVLSIHYYQKQYNILCYPCICFMN